MIHAICFDLDGVFFTEHSFPKFKRTVTEHTKHPQYVDTVFHGPMMNAFKKNTITEDEYWEYVRETLEMTLTNEELFRILSTSYSVNHEILEYVCTVKAAGYTTCVCSNNFVTRIRVLEQTFDFLKHFDVTIFSYDLGVLKPHIGIFRALVEQSGVDASAIVYSDDRASKLGGAKALGIHTFVFKHIEHFKQTLESLGVRISRRNDT